MCWLKIALLSNRMFRTGPADRLNRNGASYISPAGGVFNTCGATALPIRSILLDVPELRLLSKAAPAAKCPVRVPTRCFQSSMLRLGFRHTLA